MAGAYLEWWSAGLALGGLAMAQWLLDRRTIGVSGYVQRSLQAVLHPQLARDEERVLRADPQSLEAAMRAAMEEEEQDGCSSPPVAAPPATTTTTGARAAPPRARPVSGRAAVFYVVAMTFGAAIAAAQRGGWSLRTSLGPSYEAQWGEFWWLALLIGGVLVGLGTRMAGGCTSGHGLSGCSRFQVGSLAATATFMAMAVATTFALRGFA